MNELIDGLVAAAERIEAIGAEEAVRRWQVTTVEDVVGELRRRIDLTKKGATVVGEVRAAALQELLDWLEQEIAS